jgi:RNA polymerase sigma factor (sigma-70 family)
MRDDAFKDLIDRLSSAAGVDAAWREFLARYSPLIHLAIRRHHVDQEDAAEAYVYVCGALSDDGFRRLRSFKPDGPARFTTWLTAVASNLCIDWRRKQSGRPRPLRCISGLPPLDQWVYRCIYEKRMSRRQCAEFLAPRFPGLDEATVAAINARLFNLLAPHQRWELTLRGRARACDEHITAKEPGPEVTAEETQTRERVQQALMQLPAGQRLLLRLRYEQGLTLAEIARLTQQPDVFRTNRQLQSALRALAELVGTTPPCRAAENSGEPSV